MSVFNWARNKINEMVYKPRSTTPEPSPPSSPADHSRSPTPQLVNRYIDTNADTDTDTDTDTHYKPFTGTDTDTTTDFNTNTGINTNTNTKTNYNSFTNDEPFTDSDTDTDTHDKFFSDIASDTDTDAETDNKPFADADFNTSTYTITNHNTDTNTNANYNRFTNDEPFTDNDTDTITNVNYIIASAPTIASQCTPDEYERKAYYNGITGDDDHPELVYRSDFLTKPFPKPVGRFGHIPVKTARGVFGTPLNRVWDVVGPEICELIKSRNINWCSIDPARFLTHGPSGEEENSSLGPVVIWVGVAPNSTSSETAHEVSQEILALLLKHQVDDVVVEWREVVLQRLAGRPLMRHVGDNNATHYVRRFLTPLLGVPLAAEGMEEEDAQGTLTLWFHENKDKNGKPSDKVYGVSNCHVLRKDTTFEYRYDNSAPKDHVRVCGQRRFQRGLDEITNAIADQRNSAERWDREIARLSTKVERDEEEQDEEDEEALRAYQRNLEDVMKATTALNALQDEITTHWSDIKLHRNIGHVQYAPAIAVDVESGTRYTKDWAVFLADEAKVKDRFEGNVVDLGSKFSPPRLMEMFNPVGGSSTTFEFPTGRKLRIEGCATEEDLAKSADIDSERHLCIIVGKDGNTTDLTVGRYAGLVSFTLNEVGIQSTELGIYNSGVKNAEPFSAKGDSGSLVWHLKDGKAHIFGQLHSGNNKGFSTRNHITYCTPGCYLLDQIRKEFKHADFYRTSW